MTLEKLRIAIVRGGSASSYDTSLKSGENILKALRENERYAPADILIDRSGVWHVRGLPIEPQEALKHIDLAWNLASGLEEGRVEQHFAALRLPYIGSGSVSSALANDMVHTRTLYTREKLPTIRYAILDVEGFDDKELVQIFRNFLHPVTVRTENRGSAFSTKIAHTFQELSDAVQSAFAQGTRVIVEEYQKGKEALVGIVENARGEKYYSFLPAEVRAEEVMVPGNFSPEEKRQMREMAARAHQALGLDHISTSRFLVTPRGKVYILETHSTPDLSERSAFNRSLQATGWKGGDFIDHLVTEALK